MQVAEQVAWADSGWTENPRASRAGMLAHGGGDWSNFHRVDTIFPFTNLMNC